MTDLAAPCPDIRTNRLPHEDYQANFGDCHPALTRHEARVEASRCYYCYDAPCVEACPTGIDVPGFIRRIATGNLHGAAVTILDANIMGGMCSRVCPTEILCEQRCVRTQADQHPVAIGALQRHATDALLARGEQPFRRAPDSGRRVAVVGAGPAGLSCAHRLARLGHQVTLIEARAKPGGLNEYGIAAYKTVDDFAQREVAFILGIGSIELVTGKALGQDVSLTDLRQSHDAVFLGLGHNAVRALGVDGENLPGVRNATDFIAQLRQADDKAQFPIGRRVVVIGGGNTAVDAAVQARRLGADEVTIAYRRGKAQMSATGDEQDWAQTNGVALRLHARPRRILGDARGVQAVEFEDTREAGAAFTIAADMVLKAIGQYFLPTPLQGSRDLEPLEIDRDRIVVDADRQTSLPGVFAGGDCITGVDLTVTAVEDGKIAALAIDRLLRG
ncbi:MAG: NAD(P)-dependent oxidoreductase [Azospirillaceae bacterium]|nr:NAD(P)-dependent oxidoreductase [Azospirillaceae bacterium]